MKFLYIRSKKVYRNVDNRTVNLSVFDYLRMLMTKKSEHAFNNPVFYHQRTYRFHKTSLRIK